MLLDERDRKLLDLVQKSIPLTRRPYLAIARELGMGEDEVLSRLKRLKEAGIIRRLGGIFDSRKVGYCGTLCAARVPPERIADVARVVNAYPGVTHNYLREHTYNMWFTILAPSPERLKEIVAEIKAKTGIEDIREFPAVNIFKVYVTFAMDGMNHAHGTRETDR